MANSRAMVMIVVSAAVGVAAVLVASNWLVQRPGIDASKVVVAAKDLDLGSRLTPEALQTVDWPRSSASTMKGVFDDPKPLLDKQRVLNASVLKGEPILESKLAPEGAKAGLAAVIAEGKRAITVRVNEVIGVAGFALPGSLVDIMVSAQDEQAKPVSKIVLEQILVLAVAQEASRDETKPKVVNAVTLEVTPEQAEKIDLARSVGTLSLVLRNQMDRASVATKGVRRPDLLKMTVAEAPASTPAAAGTKPAAAARPVRAVAKKIAPVEEKPKIEVIRGIARTSVVAPEMP